MAHDVFLSYSYQDKAAADAVCHSLEAKGVRCWIAPRDVIPGEDWQQSILDAISASRAVILLFTAHTNQSDNVKKEVSAAFDANAMVIPFRIEDVPPQGSLKYHLIGVHWLDAYAPPLEEHVGHLAKIIQGLPLGHGEGPPPPPPLITPGPVPGPGPIPMPVPPPQRFPDPATGGTNAPANWDAVSLDKREGFAFLAAVIPFAPGLYLLWQTTYRQDGEKVTLVSRERKILATLLAAVIIIALLLVITHLPGRRSAPVPPIDTTSSSAAVSSSDATSSVSASSAAPASSAAWSSASADSHNRSVNFTNGSTNAIWQIRAWSTDQTESDGHDVMGSEVIMPGQSHSYTIDDGAGHCEYNLKVTGAASTPVITVNDINVCNLTTYNITP